jgi:hypothetical protein
MDKSRSIGYILAVWMATAVFSQTPSACYGPDHAVLKAACSIKSLFGLYTSSLVSTAVTAMLISPEQSICEANEGQFKFIKYCLAARCNFKFENALEMNRRHSLAHEITQRTNTTASDLRDVKDQQLQDLYRDLDMGPKSTESGNGEVRPFGVVEVHSVFFVVMWLKWLPHYLLGHSNSGQVWWKDDDVAYTQFPIGGARPICILCDFNATTGATLFDGFWLTDRDLD